MADTLLIEHPDGSTTRIGTAESSPRPEVSPFTPARIAAAELPAHVNLATQMTPVEDQGDTMSCVANAAAGAYEFLVKRHLGQDFDVSRMFIYWNARKRDGDEQADGGTAIENAIQSLIDFGACAEKSWPFDPDQVNTEPSPTAYAEAQSFRAEYTERVPTELDAWRHSLAEGHPILFMLRIYRSFHDARAGRVAMPLDRELARGKRCSHAMLCVGYHDRERLFIVRNSWGPKWGLSGYCYVPYEYILSSDFNVDDSWIIRRIADIDEIDRSTWGDALATLPTLDGELHTMSEPAYRSFLTALGEVPLMTRLALLYLAAATADGELGEKELAALSAELAQVSAELGHIGIAYEPAAVLSAAQRSAQDQTLITETVRVFAEHLSRPMRVAILRSLRRISGADQLAAAEQSFVDRLISAWQIELPDDTAAAAFPTPEGESSSGSG